MRKELYQAQPKTLPSIAVSFILIFMMVQSSLKAQDHNCMEACPLPQLNVPNTVAFEDFRINDFLLGELDTMPDGQDGIFYCFNYSFGVPTTITDVPIPPDVSGLPFTIEVDVTVVSIQFDPDQFDLPPGLEPVCVTGGLGDPDCTPTPGGEEGCFRIGGFPTEPVDSFPIIGGVTLVGSAAGQSLSQTFEGIVFDTISIAPGVLPITLSSMSAHANRDGNLIEWSTASEVDAEGFELQRSRDAKVFEAVASLDVAGSKTGADYDYLDEDYLPGKTFYRLKLVDRDGSHSFSEIINVVRKGRSESRIFPNPTDQFLYVQLEQDGSFEISNELGQSLLHREFLSGESIHQIQVDLPPGVYFGTLRTSHHTKVERIIIR